MAEKQDSDTRYFIDIDLASMKITRCDYAQKQTLDKGRSPAADSHRIFLTLGQYNKFVSKKQ